MVSSGSVSLTSKDVATARQDVQRVVDAQGGDVTEEETTTADDGAASYARLVVRVPSAKFGATMEALEQVATFRSSSRGSDDVTTEVIDTGARVRAQEASLERVELLLADARDLKDVIWIESQLTSRQAELDSLKSQQAWLRDQTSLSTITVDITVPEDRRRSLTARTSRPASSPGCAAGRVRWARRPRCWRPSSARCSPSRSWPACSACRCGWSSAAAGPDARDPPPPSRRRRAGIGLTGRPLHPWSGRRPATNACVSPRQAETGSRSWAGAASSASRSRLRPRVSGRKRAQTSESAATATL